jgi:hypothetical protein
MVRLLAPSLVGLLLAALAVACFIDPNPPHPHDGGTINEDLAALLPALSIDGGEDAGSEAGP